MYFFLFLQIGARVLKKDFLRRKRKGGGGRMDPQWLGPYLVTKDLGKGFYTLSDPNTGVVFVKRVNGSHLKTYIPHFILTEG